MEDDKKVIIGIKSGVAFCISKPQDTVIEVKDYDVDRVTKEFMVTDENGVHRKLMATDENGRYILIVL